MATVQENWQTKCTSISQRTKYIFNTALLSDVKFIVPMSNGESESKAIPAHKLVLAIGSPVFYAMFYGQKADTKDSIELPDCEYEGVLELFRFIYSDEVKLTGSNVMHVLDLAKKYLVPSLAEKCAEFLRKNLDASNAFSILSHAQKFGDKDLENRCWEVVEVQTVEALASDDFVVAERSLVESVVKREKLNVKEVELFKAVNRWAEKKIEKQGIASDCSDGKAKRRIIGEEILKEIRFPLMSLKEFATFVVDSKFLNEQEVGDMIKHYSQVLTSPLPYLQFPRTGALRRVCRFNEYYCSSGVEGGWKYSGWLDSLFFSVDKDVRLCGVQHFGREGCEYTISMEIKDATSNLSLAKKSGTYCSEEDSDVIYYGFDVLIDTPVILESGKRYEIGSMISGPPSWYGGKGQTPVNFEGINFTFSRSDSSYSGTDEKVGQFPALLFTHSG